MEARGKEEGARVCRRPKESEGDVREDDRECKNKEGAR